MTTRIQDRIILKRFDEDHDARAAQDAEEAEQKRRREQGLCLRCGRPERFNRWHCEECHEEVRE